MVFYNCGGATYNKNHPRNGGLMGWAPQADPPTTRFCWSVFKHQQADLEGRNFTINYCRWNISFPQQEDWMWFPRSVKETAAEGEVLEGLVGLGFEGEKNAITPN